MNGGAARQKAAIGIALTSVAVALSITACGGGGSSTAPNPANQGGQQSTTLTPQQRARALGKKVEQFQQQEQNKAQKNLQQYQQGNKKCPPGQSYAPQMDICIPTG